MGIIEGFSEAIGEMFLDSVIIVLVVAALLILGVLVILGRLLLPKPFGLIVGLGCLAVAVYLLFAGGIV